MRKIILAMLFVGLGISSWAGNETDGPKKRVKALQGIHKGVFRTFASFSPGFQNRSLPVNLYVYGESEYLLTQSTGINGSVYVHLGQGKKSAFISSHHNVFVGPNFHLNPDKPFDIHIGFQPGFSISTIRINPDFDHSYNFPKERSFVPQASINVGIGWYSPGNNFHISAQTRVVYGNHVSTTYELSLFEIRPTFGLGFNFSSSQRRMKKS